MHPCGTHGGGQAIHGPFLTRDNIVHVDTNQHYRFVSKTACDSLDVAVLSQQKRSVRVPRAVEP
jgi:hypothetical protein